MNWANVKLIFKRELRDQLRDRRTLFTVAILPLLLYPLMGMALMQLAQFMREHPTKIWIVGAENLPTDPALIREGRVCEDWLGSDKPDLVQLLMSSEADREFHRIVSEFKKDENPKSVANMVDVMVQEEMRKRDIDLTILIPDSFEVASELENLESVSTSTIYLFSNSASDKSNIAFQRAHGFLNRWKKGVVKETLSSHALSVALVEPFALTSADVAASREKQAALWSKILPFIVMIWCLTGAFYPAVDLCAGEKERGTFETLLSSPARRTEIAIGKLLTVVLFSIATSMLNLVSMGVTGLFVATRMSAAAGGAGIAAALGPPPLYSIGWLLLALIPISALFSAMALAAAAFARSSKEGQYYLIPLMMISMPLMMLPMLPAAKLDFGSSLIPLSGLMLLLRGLMEGQYAEILPFASPVVIVTLVCCWLAIRWVVWQFNSETVLFRASERFRIGAWFKQVLAHREELPSVGNALLCAMLILVLKFFISFGISAPTGWWHFSKQTVVILVATVAMPAVLMAMILTTNPRRSLRLRGCRWSVAAAAILMALFLHPLMMGFTALVMYVYPPSGELALMEQAVQQILSDSPGLWAVLLVFALAPAVLEEISFRGFILSGFEGLRHRWGAVLLTSLFFGLAHSVLQQSIITFGVGMVLGFIAVRTGSLIPCVLYHCVHNGTTVLFSFVDEQVVAGSGVLQWALKATPEGVFTYSMPAAVLMSVTGVLIFVWLMKDAPVEARSELTNLWKSLREWRAKVKSPAQNPTG